MRRIALLALTAWVMACTADDVEKRSTETELEPYAQPMHIGSLAAGAVVVDRSGEYNLINSALASFDGSAEVAWWSPATDPKQWLILRLPSEARVERVNLVRQEVDETATSVMIESSVDGTAWTELGILRPAAGELVSTLPTQGAVARLLRVTMLAGPEGKLIAAIPEISVDGELAREPESVEWDGLWRVNQRLLSLRSREGIVYGEVPFRLTTMKIVGRAVGGFLPFAWSKGNVVGYGALSLSSAGEMNGLWYWEFPFTWRLAETWFGTREAGGGDVVLDRRRFAIDFLKEGHPSPFYELAFDGNTRVESPAADEALEIIRDIVVRNPDWRFRVSVWDVTGAGPAAARLAAIESALRSAGPLPSNVVFDVKAGNLLDQPPRNPITRAIFDRVDLEAAPADGGGTEPIVLR